MRKDIGDTGQIIPLRPSTVNGYGRALDEPDEPPYVPLVLYDVAVLLEQPAPPRQWCVPGLIPKRDVTLFAADGGFGKTTLALQLGDARARNWTWMGREIEHGRTVFYGAEDDRDELHYRLEQIARQICAGDHIEDRFKIITVADSDAELVVPDKAMGVRTTARFGDLEGRVADLGAGLLILDASADIFGGDEIRRREVRAFIRLLRGLGIRQDCAVLLLGHPSAEGMRSGSGYSGSTHWNNSVRSRLYGSIPTGEGGAEIDPDLRQITVKKANRGPRGETITLRWRDGVFVPESPAAASDALGRGHARAVFLELLRELTRQGRRVSANKGPTYAPAIFAAEPDAKGIKNKAFTFAMSELLRDGIIEVCEDGPASKRRSFLRIVEQR